MNAWQSEPGQLLRCCFAHGACALKTASSMTSSTETASAAKVPTIDRLKMNMAAPSKSLYGEPMTVAALSRGTSSRDSEGTGLPRKVEVTVAPLCEAEPRTY